MKRVAKAVSSLRLREGQHLLEEDFYSLCLANSIVVRIVPLEVQGVYYAVSGIRYIAINLHLEGWRRVVTMFHEYGHYLLHTCVSGTTENFSTGTETEIPEEKEAEVFAHCAVLQKDLLETKTVGQLVGDLGYPYWLVRKRIRIYYQYGI
jgi:Zn-dependent peptidase ImmA (M78 family)